VNGDKVTIDKYAIVHGNRQLFVEVRILRLPCCYFLMQSQISIGKIVEIIVSESTPHLASHIVIWSLHFLPDIHPQLQLPQLQLADEDHLLLPLVRPIFYPLQITNLHRFQNILSAVNVQHDCASSSCSEFVSINIHQECTETMKTKTSLVHKNTGRFVLNAHSLHNYALISQVIPRPLCMAMDLPYLPNSQEVQLKAARAVRVKKAGITDPAECIGSAPSVFECRHTTRKPKQDEKGKKVQQVAAGPSLQPPIHPSPMPQTPLHPLAHLAFSIPLTPLHLTTSHPPPMPAYAGTYHYPVYPLPSPANTHWRAGP
jgi:hypothetical protein